MSNVFVIAEAACTWRYGDEMATAERSIRAAKECGADAWKTQWTSNPAAMAKRRGVSTDYGRLAWPVDLHERLMRLCNEYRLEYMATVYLIEDIKIAAKYVKRFKIAAFESGCVEFTDRHAPYGREVLISVNPGAAAHWNAVMPVRLLHCVSLYPTSLEDLQLKRIIEDDRDGLSDHTRSLVSGAVAVGLGARAIEKHLRLVDTPTSDPDYPHSLDPEDFARYVANIREAERMVL